MATRDGEHKVTGAGRVFAAIGEVPIAAGVALIAAALGAAWLLTILAGGARHMAPHQFYLPIVIAAVRFRISGAVATGVVAAVLAGPLTPAQTATGAPQALTDWLSRGGFFVVIGAFLAVVVAQSRRAHDQELELLRREHELDEQRQRLLQAVSHEFRTPLTVIIGLAELLPKRPHLSKERYTDLLHALARSADRLAELVAVVLAAAEQSPYDERGDEVIDIAELLRSIAHRLDAVYAASGRVVCRPGDRAARILGDAAQLRLALTEVVKNALKYSPRSEPVVVTTQRADDEVVIVVRDRGPGVPPDIRDDVRPFRQGADAGGGLGIGLYAAVHVVERVGGSVRVDDASGGGTEVTLSLPQRRTADEVLRPRSRSGRQLQPTSPL